MFLSGDGPSCDECHRVHKTIIDCPYLCDDGERLGLEPDHTLEEHESAARERWKAYLEAEAKGEEEIKEKLGGKPLKHLAQSFILECSEWCGYCGGMGSPEHIARVRRKDREFEEESFWARLETLFETALGEFWPPEKVKQEAETFYSDEQLAPEARGRVRRFLAQHYAEQLRAERVIEEAPAISAELWNAPAADLRRRPKQAILETGLTPLDETLGGGIRTGQIAIVQGAPDSGKSTLVDQLALRFAEQGAFVAILAPDPGAPAATCRLGTELGLDPEKLLHGDAGECDRLEAMLAERRISVPDEKETFESVLAQLRAKVREAAETERVLGRLAEGAGGVAPEETAKDAPLVIVADSLQRVRFQGANGEPERLRLTHGLDGIDEEVSGDPRLLVILTSEVSRGRYASPDPEKRTEPLAAGAETRAIEYRADVLMDLEGSEGKTRIKVEKNKQTGRKGRFRVQLDKTATFREVDEAGAAQERDEANERNRERKAGAALDRIHEAYRKIRKRMLKENPNSEPVISLSRVIEEAGLNRGRQDCKDAVRAATEAQGLFEKVEKTKGTFIRPGENFKDV